MSILITQSLAQESIQTTLSNTSTFIDSITALVNSISGMTSITIVIALLIEFLLRFIKTEKPKSIFLGIKVLFNILGKMFFSLANLCVALSELFDKIIPQRIEKNEEKRQ